jgi:hypothetical protein
LVCVKHVVVSNLLNFHRPKGENRTAQGFSPGTANESESP